MAFVLALSSTANAAVYLWNGSAADGLWETPANWTVTDSTWTWPNEENAADPNSAVFINSDALAINIIDGGAVTRGDGLRILGADGLTPAVLTLDNASSLTVSGRLSIGKSPDDQTQIGELNGLGGSTLTILAGDDGDDLNIADDANSVGMVYIVGSTVDVAGQINLDEGLATLNITDSTITLGDHFTVGNNEGSVCYVNIDGASTIDIGGGDKDLEVGDGGEAHVTISGSTTINADDLYLNEKPGDAATLDVSGTVTITLADDFFVGEEGNGTATIGGEAVINVGDDIKIGEKEGSVGILNIGENATVSSPDEVYLANNAGATGTLNVSGNGTFNVDDDIDVGDDDLGYCNISENATVNIEDTLYLATNTGAEGHVTISDSATVNIGGDLTVGNAAGNTATLHISGNPTISVADQFYMNDDDGDPSTSQVIMDGGTVTIDGYCTFNDDNPGTAEFIMNSGSFYAADYINVSDNLDGTAHLTMNGGEMITGNRLRLGKDGGDDTGQVRIFMNGGLLQAEELSDIKITDTQIIYTGGVFRIGAASLDVAGMQQLVADGTIVIEDVNLVHSIVSNGVYTEISPLSPMIPQMPLPADGAEGVPLGTSLSWAPGATAATNDVYFGTTNPPAFAASVEAAPYYPGPIEPGTTYYWQVDAVEADGTTKHSSEVWSFTATTETNNAVVDIRIAAGSDDAEEDVGGGSEFEIDLTSSDLEFMYDDDPNDPNDEQVVGIRFVDVGIPAGAIITSASVQFDADDIDNDRHIGDTYALIEGELNPNPDTFEDTLNNITARPRTTAIVTWAPAQWMETHLQSPDEATSDISSIIQEIVDQDGWAAGNALVLIFSQDPANPSVGLREAESFNGAGDDTVRRPRLHIEAVVSGASQPSPADGAEGAPLDVTLGWWPGINAVSHNVYLSTSAATSLAIPPAHLVDGDSHSLPWVVADGTISFNGQINDDGGDPEFIAAGASGNTFDIPDDSNWAKLSFDFDVDFVEFIYGGNMGNITVEAKDNVGALVDSLYQADTFDGQPAGPVTLAAGPVTLDGSGIRSLHWKSTSLHNSFAALDNITLFIVPPALLGSTTQVSFDPGVLVPGTTYYWQVDTVEADGTIHTGAVWSFTTEPGEATQPDPADKAVGVALDKILSWKPGVTSATHDVYFGTTSPPPLIGNQEDPNFDPGPLEMETTYYWQVDEIEADGTTVYTGDIWSFKTPRPGTGTILREVWEGIAGEVVSDLTDSADYPGNPTYSDELTSFDVPEFGDPGLGADFGSRLHGYLHPDTSGDYTFWIASDDSSELWLSTDESPANAVLISTVDGWADHLDFDNSNVTPSEPISLVGGEKYYVMALYKEGGGGDNCAVAWEGPDSLTRAVIHGYYLSPYVEFKATSPDPADGTIEVPKTLTISWTPGGTAASHDVYFSADQQAVIDGTALISVQTETSYSPAGLEKGITYYWRVDEVEADGTTKHTGDVWSFTVTTLGR